MGCYRKKKVNSDRKYSSRGWIFTWLKVLEEVKLDAF